MTLPDDIAIQTVALSKKYRIFENARGRLKEALDPWGRSFHQDFWALRDVSLTIKKGHTVGILGRNGSGKSTLLQLVTEVMQPTSGTVAVAGRVTALLELGAGFDPDFTGRENARQFGRLQGLSAREIETRLADIEDFAGIGDFFDREVKTYSSGMFARLAFASAINVDPDILILDEILAVGDARFQQRCYERIMAIQEAGKTVLLVSHDMETIIDHCDSAILLDQGTLITAGLPKAVTDRYRELLFDEIVKQFSNVPAPAVLSKLETHDSEEAIPDMPPLAAVMLAQPESEDRFALRPGYNPLETLYGDSDGEILDYRIEVDNGEANTDHFISGSVIRFYVLVRSRLWHKDLQFGCALRRTDGLFVYGCNTVMRPEAFRCWALGDRRVFSYAYKLQIQSMHYFIDFGIFRSIHGETVRLRTRRNCVEIVVLNTPYFDGVADIADMSSLGGPSVDP